MLKDSVLEKVEAENYADPANSGSLGQQPLKHFWQFNRIFCCCSTD